MSDNSWGSWWEEKSKQAKLLASQAQEAASEVTKKYELDKHASSIISGISEISAAATETLKEAQKEVAKKEKKPVDVESLDFTYITENIVAMAFPFDPAKKKMKGGNDINLVSQYMAEKHGGKFMIWNISEDTYDYSKFDDQVLGKYNFNTCLDVIIYKNRIVLMQSINFPAILPLLLVSCSRCAPLWKAGQTQILATLL